MARVIPQSQLELELRRLPGVQEAVARVAEAVANEARLITLSEAYDTGRLASGIHVVVTPKGASARSSVNHAAPVEGGTGLYGPRKARIYARPGKPFVFRTRLAPRNSMARGLSAGLGGVNRKVVLTSHAGMPGRHPMERAGRLVAGSSTRLNYREHVWSLARL